MKTKITQSFDRKEERARRAAMAAQKKTLQQMARMSWGETFVVGMVVLAGLLIVAAIMGVCIVY